MSIKEFAVESSTGRSPVKKMSQHVIYEGKTGLGLDCQHPPPFLHAVNCSDPATPGNGFIETYQNTTEGAEISFRCNSQFVPNATMMAVCAADGMWNPDPATHVCTCKWHSYILMYDRLTGHFELGQLLYNYI